MKIKCISPKRRGTRSESITWRQNQTHNEVFAIVKAAEEQGRRATAQIFHSYQQRLHKQRGSSHLPGVGHICAQQPQLLPKAENDVFTPLKKQAIHYHPLIPNRTPSEGSRAFCVQLIQLFKWWVFPRFNISFFFCQSMLLVTMQIGVQSLVFFKWENQTIFNTYF